MKQLRTARLIVSELGLGTAGLCQSYKGRAACEDASKLLIKAVEYGINFFDTAPAYGSEALLGATLGDCHSMCIATKFSRTNWRDSIRNSLALLQHVDVFQLHNATAADIILLREVRIYLQDVYEWDGLIGATVYDPEGEGRPLIDAGCIDLLQIPFNFLDQRASTLFEDADQSGVAFVLRSVLLGGILTPQSPHCEVTARICESLDSTPEMLPIHAIRFALSQGYPVLVGMSSSNELYAALEATQLGSLKGDFRSLAIKDLDLIDLRRIAC